MTHSLNAGNFLHCHYFNTLPTCPARLHMTIGEALANKISCLHMGYRTCVLPLLTTPEEHVSWEFLFISHHALFLLSPKVACSSSIPARWPTVDNLISCLCLHIPQNRGHAASAAGWCASRWEWKMLFIGTSYF